MPQETKAPKRVASRRNRQGAFVGFRAPNSLKEQLAKAAASNGRSLSTETQVRLEQSFLTDELRFLSAVVRQARNHAIGAEIKADRALEELRSMRTGAQNGRRQ